MFLNRTIQKVCDKTSVQFTVVREINAGFILYLLLYKMCSSLLSDIARTGRTEMIDVGHSGVVITSSNEFSAVE